MQGCYVAAGIKIAASPSQAGHPAPGQSLYIVHTLAKVDNMQQFTTLKGRVK